VALIPEGLVEFIPEMKTLIEELNDIMAEKGNEFLEQESFSEQRDWLVTQLSDPSGYLFTSLPEEIAKELLIDRDSHGNVQVSRIETEKLLMGMTASRLADLKEQGKYKGSFSTLAHFFGYEGRCAFPSNFDADYCYSLGFSAFVLIASGLTGYIANVRNLTAPADQWIAGGVPLTMMMNMEHRQGEEKPVIRKALVEMNSKPFLAFAAERDVWKVKTSFVYPGSVQYFGPPEVCDQPTITLKLEKS
jgi:pyrophosphate--fructose-6-phosphate 1-phosphotransferase